MELAITSEELYQKQLYLEIKKGYQQRLSDLNSSLTNSLNQIHNSEILKEMSGNSQLNKLALNHIQEIVKHVFSNQQEITIEQQLRTISELKALIAVLKMQLQFTKKKNPSSSDRLKSSDRKLKELQEQNRCLRKQLQSKDDPNLQVLVDREIKKKIKILEGDYILKVQHQRLIHETEKNLKQKLKYENKKWTELETSHKTLEQKRKKEIQKYISEIEQLKTKIRFYESKQSFDFKPSDDIKQVYYDSKNNEDSNKIQEKLLHYKESEKIPNVDTSLQNFQRKRRNDFNYLEIATRNIDKINTSQNKIQSKSKILSSQEELQVLIKSPKIQKANIESIPPPTNKFQQIQNSFAKQLAQLRAKMSKKRQWQQQRALEHSPYMRLKPRESSVRRNKNYNSTNNVIYSPGRYKVYG